MNIIFGREHAATMSEKYTVLELDTIRIGAGGQELTAFCVVENISILDMPKIENMKDLHQNLLTEYRKKNWNYCSQAIEHLKGFWNGEIDTFYDHLQERINEYTTTPPGEDWDWVIEKSAT